MNILIALLHFICLVAMIDAGRRRYEPTRIYERVPVYKIRGPRMLLECREETDCPDDRLCDDGVCLNANELFEKYH
ncbi:unnamed protein product [Caenorhabditis bovis]|uniref:Uncharacterized protein n=1 Tax=Caenorhabditis bovis TaxID=2654633 RepID=A0A8S1EM41_9PELO|nr:unnamed protein product [Caenorhabditis bovis]